MKFLLFVFLIILFIYSFRYNVAYAYNTRNTRKHYFFDNCLENLQGLDDVVVTVKVDDNKHITKTDPIAFQQYVQTLSLNAQKYAAFSYDTHRFDCFDPKSQISLSQIRALINAIQDNRVQTLIFDWDRTLTKFVDVVDEREYFTSTIFTMKNVAEFYFGDRFDAFSLMWQEARNKGVNIFIISTNPRAESDPFLFVNLLSCTGLDLPVKNLIYVNDSYEKRNMVRKIVS